MTASWMFRVPGVRNVHDIHVWTIAPRIHALSCHVELEDMPISQAAAVLRQLNGVLGNRFGIGHATIQVECAGCDLEGVYCTLTPDKTADHAASDRAAHSRGAGRGGEGGTIGGAVR